MAYQKASEFTTDDKCKALVHANSGAGKSTLGASVKNPIIALCERQALRAIRRRNPDATIWMVESTEDLRNLLIDLKMQTTNGTCPFDTVVLDSLTEMQSILKREILKKGSSTRDSLTVGEWGMVIDRTTDVVRSFRDLPLHVLVLCRSEESFVDDSRFVRPSLNGKKLPNDIAGFFNIVGYGYKKLNAEGSVIHRVLFDGVEGFLTKGDPDLENVEIPFWPSWLRKMYKEVPGAATDAEMQPNFILSQGQREPIAQDTSTDTGNGADNKTSAQAQA